MMGQDNSYQLCNSFCYPALVTAWLGLYVPTFFIIVHSSTTDVGITNVTVATSVPTAAPVVGSTFNFLNILPQSAISIFSLGLFMGISVVVGYFAEKCYERLSLRDDSSDMSEHTKEILRARILGMVFGKKVQFSLMSDKQRKIELTKKYAHLWQYKAAMMRQRRLHQSKEKKRKSSLFGGFFNKNENKEEGKPARPPSAARKSSKGIIKKPSMTSISESPLKENSLMKDKRQVVEEDFVAIDIKAVGEEAQNVHPVTANAQKNKISGIKNIQQNNTALSNKQSTFLSKNNDIAIDVDTNELNDEFDFTDVAPSVHSAKQINAKKTSKDSNLNLGSINRESSMNKYVRPPSGMGGGSQVNNKNNKNGAGGKSFSRPLTAGGSRPITAGAKRATAEYKAQGKSVRSDMIKRMGQLD